MEGWHGHPWDVNMESDSVMTVQLPGELTMLVYMEGPII